MPAIPGLLSDYELLNDKEKVEFINIITALALYSSNMNEYLTETKLSQGIICPHCGSVEVVKNGTNNGI